MNLKEDASFLVGEELLQICYGLYDLQFHFYNPNTHISSHYKVELILPNNECIVWDESDGRRLVSFNCLIGRTITVAEFNSIEDKLTLVFGAHGSLFFLKDTEEKGESYIVHWEKGFQVF